MTTEGVLLLSHCGFSFLEDLLIALEQRGMQRFILSSLPLPEHPRRLHDLGEKADVVLSTASHALTANEVTDALNELHNRGFKVLCCISVWEGYRGLMALANQLLGVPDLTPPHVAALRNKLELRNRLLAAELSGARAMALTPTTLKMRQQDGGRYFIKPVCGIASYGAFALKPTTTWADIDAIVAGARLDTVYQSAFGAKLEFLIEDYLPGREYSFEIIAIDGQLNVVAIHEKCEVTELAGTVLENACTSPPSSLDQAACAAGIQWVGEMFELLDLRWGCFHLEARHDGQRWDLIEINPRVGGSLISHSVAAQNQTSNLLDLWLDVLLASRTSALSLEAVSRYIHSISYTRKGRCTTSLATFFRVYFAEPGLIETLTLVDQGQPPSIAHVLLKAGDHVPAADREVFLGQLMWTFPLSQHAERLALLMESSNQAIDIRYHHELSEA